MARTDNGSPAGRQAEPDGPARRLCLDDGYALQIPASPAISPDGEHVVYVLLTTDRDADQDRYALWQVSAGGGDPVQLTRGTADTAPAWSPDGSRIAFLRGGDGPAAGAQAAGPSGDERREGEPVVVDRLGYKAGGTGLLRTLRRHVHVADPATGEVRQVTRGDWPRPGRPAPAPAA